MSEDLVKQLHKVKREHAVAMVICITEAMVHREHSTFAKSPDFPSLQSVDRERRDQFIDYLAEGESE